MVMDKKISINVGLFIVFGTHIPMLADYIPMATFEDRRNHAIANIIAAGLISYGVYA